MPLKPAQRLCALSRARFIINHSGRRSGKTEIEKRRIVKAALAEYQRPDWWGVLAAPTHKQAKRIYWNDLKKLCPPEFVHDISESELTVTLINGAQLTVMGMDKPERIEGRPLDYVLLDEYGNMRAEVWTEHVRPALSTPGRRPGVAVFIGVPEGRNHYYRLAQAALVDTSGDWAVFHWHSDIVLAAEEIAAARRDLDDRTYGQEYGGEFIDFAGRVYYAFDREIHARERLKYDPHADLAFCFDFNVNPGVCAIIQEQSYAGAYGDAAARVTGVIGEVYIPTNSNTVKVCHQLVDNWGTHEGLVGIYGDATGGARGTAKVDGSDWDLVNEVLRPKFGGRMRMRVPKSNPRERVRVNATNSRIRAADGTVSLFVDPVAAPHVVLDLEGVTGVEDGSGEIDKKTDPTLTHISDAVGYYVAHEHPTCGTVTKTRAL
jgi:hypothetical protein